jgi:ParB family chromosome partitioning protein
MQTAEPPFDARSLPLAEVYANPDQPRKYFDPVTLAGMARSIHRSGVFQPITVVSRPCPLGRYMLVMGERRFRASKIAEKTEIPAIVRVLTDSEVAELALVENLGREDLKIVEEAKGYQAFIDQGYTVETLAAKLGIVQPWRIQDRLNLLKLAPTLLDGLDKGAISPTQAYEMSKLSVEGQFVLWQSIQDGRCPTAAALKRLAATLLDQQNQVELFKTTLTPDEKKAVTKVGRFIERAGRLLSVLTPAEMAILNDVPKADARLCADQLGLLEKMCRELRDSLLSNAVKQELMKKTRKRGKKS